MVKIKNSTYNVFTIDMPTFIAIEIAKRKGQLANSEIIVKMDIVDSEYSVFPTMMFLSDILCSISYLGLEWHNKDALNPDIKGNEFKTLNFTTKQAKNCRTVISDIDDNVYGHLGVDKISLDLHVPMIS